MATITSDEKAALQRLLDHAQRDTGQSRRVADFLLAWWNAKSCGGFDITSAWGLDDEIAADVITVFGAAVRCNVYPDTLGFGPQFERIVREWRPELTPKN
ncbi:hypothetical protein PQQ51_33465 [Paraburkholderia xenovorans]|uniref:DUF7673 family protein n=1 Tax=Paraburkholderia xenovorans TaxID=36873 RepID=UPI0038B9C68F